MESSASPETILNAVKTAVQNKKGARAIVEALRGAALLVAPAPPLFPTLLAALQQLKCNKKAGEENKAVRHCYQYISWLASSGLLREEQALQVMFQLSGIDLRDELVPRQLAAQGMP